MRASGYVLIGAALLLACGRSSGKGRDDGTAPGDTPTVPPGTAGTPQAPTPVMCPGGPGIDVPGTGAPPSSAGASVPEQPPGPRDRCAALTPRAPARMEQHVVVPQGPPAWCGAGIGDASGTLALPMVFSWGMINDSTVAFVRTTGEVLGEYASSEIMHLLPQPRGFAATAQPAYGHGPPIVRQLRWTSEGRAFDDGSFWWDGSRHQVAADPNGGVLLAGDVSPDNLGTLQHSAVMFAGGDGPVAVRWGRAPLASSGRVLGVGVDVLGRAIVMTDGSSRFGADAVSAQWFDRDGTAMTGEFLLVRRHIADPCADTWLETSPLIGGGVAVRRMALRSFPSVEAQALVVVQSGVDTAEPAPEWMTARPGTRLEIVRGGEGYAVVPYGARGVACTQRIELLAPDGTSCGSLDFPIANGTCNTRELSVAADGTVVQQLPLSMETLLDTGPGNPHTCTWRFWPQALR